MKPLLLLLLAFPFLASSAFADAACPDLKAQALCENDSWRLTIDLNNSEWKPMGESVTGKPCKTGAETKTVWQYAFYVRSTAGCNYQIQDVNNNLIGTVQIKSWTHFPLSEDWQIGNPYYPGYKTCRASREKCTFK